MHTHLSEVAIPLWAPRVERITRTRLDAFKQSLGRGSDTYDQLHEWSIANPSEFWTSVWDFCGVVGNRGDSGLQHGSTMLEDAWFRDARLNVVDTLLAELREKPDGAHVNWTLVEELAHFGGIRIEDDLVVTLEGAHNLTRPSLPDGAAYR